MQQAIITLLIVTNVLTGAALYQLREKHQEVTSFRLSDEKRTHYGHQCVTWLTEVAKKEGQAKATYKLARSWQKHGQLVFEVVADWDQDDFKADDVLCVVDEQSGMLFSYNGISREPWLFYK